MTPERSFKPMVMFFRLTNSPATFQTMMNKLLRDLINIGKGVAFIDDVIIGMESEEGHDELVAEVIKRLEENNLYMKPEKCKWKVREVGFFRSGNQSRWDKNKRGEGERCFELANTQVC